MLTTGFSDQDRLIGKAAMELVKATQSDALVPFDVERFQKAQLELVSLTGPILTQLKSVRDAKLAQKQQKASRQDTSNEAAQLVDPEQQHDQTTSQQSPAALQAQLTPEEVVQNQLRSYVMQQAAISMHMRCLSCYLQSRALQAATMVLAGEDVDETMLDADEKAYLQEIYAAINQFRMQTQLVGYPNGWELMGEVQAVERVDMVILQEGYTLTLEPGEIFYGSIDDCWQLVTKKQAVWRQK